MKCKKIRKRVCIESLLSALPIVCRSALAPCRPFIMLFVRPFGVARSSMSSVKHFSEKREKSGAPFNENFVTLILSFFKADLLHYFTPFSSSPKPNCLTGV